MARLETTCGRCGASIRLAVTDLRLLSSDAEADRFSFSCPLCGQPTTRTADPRQLAILRAIGVPVAEGGAVGIHPEGPDPSAPPLTRDDLLRFHEQLETDGWFPSLAADVRAGRRPGPP